MSYKFTADLGFLQVEVDTLVLSEFVEAMNVVAGLKTVPTFTVATDVTRPDPVEVIKAKVAQNAAATEVVPEADDIGIPISTSVVEIPETGIPVSAVEVQEPASFETVRMGSDEYKAKMSQRLKESWARRKAEGSSVKKRGPVARKKQPVELSSRAVKLRSMRTERNLTQWDLAKKLGIGQKRVSDWELGGNPSGLDEAWTKILGVFEAVVQDICDKAVVPVSTKGVHREPVPNPQTKLYRKVEVENEQEHDLETCTVRWIVAFKAVCLRAELCTVDRITETLNAEDPWLKITPGQVAAVLHGRQEDVTLLECALAKGNEAFQREKLEVQVRLRGASTDEKVTFFGDKVATG